MVGFAEDMSYNNGPMLSYDMFKSFLTPYYQQVIPHIKKWGVPVLIDSDGDTYPAECDQAPDDPASWSPPSEARNLILSRIASVAQLAWSAPESLGGLTVSYTILRSEDPAAFLIGSTATIDCLPDSDPNDLSAEDEEIPAAAFYYLVRADHGLEGMVGPNRERGETWSCP